MSKTAYIVKAYRTAVGKAPKGLFRFKRPDELAAETIEFMMNEVPQLDKKRIDDVMVGNAMPEAVIHKNRITDFDWFVALVVLRA